MDTSSPNVQNGPSLSGEAQKRSAVKLSRVSDGKGSTPAMGPLRPSDVDFMPGILRSLSVLLRLRGRAVSPQALMAGLSGSQVTPQACLRAVRKAGLTGRITYRPDIENIPGLVLPCILLCLQHWMETWRRSSFLKRARAHK